MNKDVIYIDVDDDVTAIIGKIKQAKEKIVALVPPKRAGALQSAVNLRLLDRMAKAENKRMVLITNNQALVALAANAQIPVAKNLQTKPEIADVPALIVDDGDDIINGADLPVGDHAKTARTASGTGTRVASDGRSKAVEETNLDIDTDDGAIAPVAASASSAAAATTAKKSKSKTKIPNFDTFRKKLVLGIAGGVALVALLVWMFVFAPAATVVITARTSPQPVSASVKLGGTAATDYKAGIVSSVAQQSKKDATVEFTATGTGTVGEKARGNVVFKNCEDSAAITIPAGTTISSGAQRYVTQTAVTVPGGTGSFFGCTTPGTSTAVEVVAAEIGPDFNADSGESFAVSGHPNSASAYMRAVASTDIAGGTSREVKVVSAEDIERAKGELIGQSTDAEKKALIKTFTKNEKVIDSSFTVERGEPVSAPALNQEAATGKAKLTIPTTYTIYAVSASDIETYLKASISSKIDQNTQKIYSSGAEKATLSNFRKDGETLYATVNANGKVGPKINEEDIKQQVKGKIYGEVQQALESQDGISAVDVQFSYFWVRTVPGDTNKIKIEFKVTDEQ